ncbi:hypothetical protein [Sphingomonas sp.]|uniref:hypothetical protein n=1 Tax=Sphingomonas sp. TaxID=28214 RepID=UPI002ED94743
MRNPLGRWRRPLAALAALAATLVLGLAGPALPGAAPLFGWGGLGLLVAGSAGLLAWHLARLSITPAGRSGQIGAALPAALLALSLPGIGPGAVLAPCALAILATRRDASQSLVALAVHCSAAALLLGDWLTAGLACAMTPGMAWLSLRGAFCAIANDNPSLERIEDICSLQRPATYANDSEGESGSGTWGVA